MEEMVFQDLVLWPHLTVYKNVDYVSSSVIKNRSERKKWNLEILEKFKPIVVAPVWSDFSRELVEMCHAAGAIVIVDERDKTSWPRALEWEANGIQTDHPKELIEFIRKNRIKEYNH